MIYKDQLCVIGGRDENRKLNDKGHYLSLSEGNWRISGRSSESDEYDFRRYDWKFDPKGDRVWWTDRTMEVPGRSRHPREYFSVRLTVVLGQTIMIWKDQLCVVGGRDENRQLDNRGYFSDLKALPHVIHDFVLKYPPAAICTR
jgi:hypothetical protein